MRGSAFVAYSVSDVLCTNSVPHFLIAATGRRNLTPFGRTSSAAVNLLWAMLNAGGGYVLLRQADRSTGATRDETTWQLPFEAGCLFWASFGVVYAFGSAPNPANLTKAGGDVVLEPDTTQLNSVAGPRIPHALPSVPRSGTGQQ